MSKVFISQKLERYSRQIAFLEIGETGQQKLEKSRVMILGLGGLGATSASILARAGVGYLKLVDRDIVEMNNLQRQILYTEDDARQALPKAIAAKMKIEKINSSIQVEPVMTDVHRLNIEKLISDVDLVIDGTDNFETRFLLNEACIKHGRAWIYGAAVESYGLMMNIIPGKTPCLRCIVESVPDPSKKTDSETVGVLGSIVTIIASLQCTEAIKILTENYKSINTNLLSFDLYQNSFQEIDARTSSKIKNCPVCNQRFFDLLEGKRGSIYSKIYGNNAVQIIPFEKKSINLELLASNLKIGNLIAKNNHVLKIQQDEKEILLFSNGRLIVKGTLDIPLARDIFKKLVENH